MTVQEALKILHGETREDALYIYDREDRPYILARAERMAIQALEELEQYRALGTVEELKEAMEKQVAKKPTHHTETHPISSTTVNFEKIYQCENCHSIVKEEWNFCTLCGQALKWGEEDD